MIFQFRDERKERISYLASIRVAISLRRLSMRLFVVAICSAMYLFVSAICSAMCIFVSAAPTDFIAQLVGGVNQSLIGNG